MTRQADVDIQLALLEGARDRLRSLGRTDFSEALLVVHSLRDSARSVGLAEVLPLLDRVTNDLALEMSGSVDQTIQALQGQIRVLRSTDTSDADDFQQAFFEEATEHLKTVRAVLSDLGKDISNREALDELSRTIHTIKGAASMVGRHETAHIAHLFEDFCTEIRSHQRTLTPGLVRRLIQAADYLERLLDAPQHAKEVEVALLVLLGQGDEEDRPSEPLMHRRSERRRDTQSFLQISLADAQELDEKTKLIRKSVVQFGWFLSKVDSLQNSLGSASFDGLSREFGKLERATLKASSLIRKVRSTRVSRIFDRLVAAAEEIGQRQGQQFSIERSGDDILIDRNLALWITDPLVHLVRNAISHGFEQPAQRIASEKQPSGLLTLKASTQDSQIVFSVCDDGRGIDPERIRQQVLEMGLCSEEEAYQADEQKILSWIFLPGVSTRHQADELSGRGVGLDAVRSEVTRHGGRVTAQTWKDRGTQFDIEVLNPGDQVLLLTFSSGGERYALALSSVDRVMPLRTLEMGTVIPIGHLLVDKSGKDPSWGIKVARGILGVDTIHGTEKASLYPLGGRLKSIGPYQSVGKLGSDHSLVLVLDERELFKIHRKRQKTPVISILLVEDSLTMRSVFSRMLMSEGMDVVEATNGQNALELLEKHTFDLIVTDLKMPVLDGFGLMEVLAQKKNTSKTPIIVITIDGEEKDRVLSLGARRFVLKNEREDALIRAVYSVLEELNQTGRQVPK